MDSNESKENVLFEIALDKITAIYNDGIYPPDVTLRVALEDMWSKDLPWEQVKDIVEKTFGFNLDKRLFNYVCSYSEQGMVEYYEGGQNDNSTK